jgi:hypothetical protein
MVSEINSNNLEQLRNEIKDLEVEIMIKERKVKELEKAPWHITLISWIIGFCCAFLLLVPAIVAAFQKNWQACIICLVLFIVIIFAYGAFLSHGTEHGRKYKKAFRSLEQAKKKKKTVREYIRLLELFSES